MKNKKKVKDWVMVNLKVKKKHLVMLNAKAKELTDGNKSKLLLLSALNRKTKFQAYP